MSPRDQVPWKFVLGTLILALCALVLSHSLSGCDDAQSPTGSELSNVEARRLEVIATNDIAVTVKHEGRTTWTSPQAIIDGMRMKVSAGVTLLQFEMDGVLSPMFSFSYPDIETCFVFPAWTPGTGAWRLTYGPQPGVFPENGIKRSEMVGAETLITEIDLSTWYMRVERWDDAAGEYGWASGWFSFTIAPAGDEDPEFERSADE